MAPLPGLPTPNAPGTGSMSPAAPAGMPDPMAQNPQGAKVPTGLQYGQRQALQQAQRSMPLPDVNTIHAPQAGGGAPAALPPDHPDTLAAAHSWTPPIQPLSRPSNRPGEPVQSGIPLGPGPGPEALAGPSTQPSGVNTNLSSLLAQIAQGSGSKVVADLAQRAAAAGQ